MIVPVALVRFNPKAWLLLLAQLGFASTVTAAHITGPATAAVAEQAEGALSPPQRLDLNMFLSVRTKKDNTAAGRKFHQALLEKGYPVAYLEVPFVHDWQPQLDDILQYYFGRGEDPV